MMIIRRNVRLWGAAVLLGAVCAGCSISKTASHTAAEQSSISLPQSSSSTSAPQLAVSPPTTPEQIQNALNSSEMPGQAQNAVQPTGTNSTTEETPSIQPALSDKKVQTSSDAKPPETDAASPANESYDFAKPSLMGIRLTDTRTAVVGKFDKPVTEFEMDDGQDPVTVYEYDGFIVGFNADDIVEFVEITSKDVNPGLNGLRLGQQVKDAETALGNPDTNTNYALHYKTDTTVLKLDIDPKTESIQSIKLFANRP